MKLYLGILNLCMGVYLSGMDLADSLGQSNKKLTLHNAIELVGNGKKLVVYYNDDEKPIKDYAMQLVKNVREQQSMGQHITDYVVNGALQYESKPQEKWSDIPTSIDAIVSTKRGSGFYPCGFVIYTTQCDEDYAFNRYVNHLNLLLEAHVPVIVYAHNKRIAENILENLCIEESEKNLIINGLLIPAKNEWKKHLVTLSFASLMAVLWFNSYFYTDKL